MKKKPKYIQPHRTPRTTIGIKANTKEKLDQHRAPGQCYDGFICQLLEMWEESRSYDHHRALFNTSTKTINSIPVPHNKKLIRKEVMPS